MSVVLKHLGYFYSWVTHLGRQGGYGNAEQEGADLTELKTLSRHAQDVGNRNYSSSIPAGVICVLCDLGTNLKAIFYPQDTVKISEDLAKTVFPFAWTELVKIEERNARAPKDISAPDGYDKAAVDFVEFMKQGAYWLIQHVAVMQDKFPDHPVFHHKTFKVMWRAKYRHYFYFVREITVSDRVLSNVHIGMY